MSRSVVSAKISLVILILIVLLGALLRLYRLPELTTFRSDQAIELGSTADILKGDFTLIGIKTSNSEIRNGAVMYYLLAPFLYLFNYDPVAGGVLQTLLSLGTIALTYLITREFLSRKFALFASFLVAVSPQLVLYSRQTLLAFYPLFFSALLFYLSIKTLQVPKMGKFLILGILAGFSLQIHYSMLVWVGVVLVLPVFLKRKDLKTWLFIISGLIIGFSPMLAFEFRNQFFNTKMLIEFVATRGGSESSFNLFVYLFNSLNSYFTVGSGLLLIALGGFLIKPRNIVDKVAILAIGFQFLFLIFLVRDNPPHYLLPSIIPLIILFASLLNKIKVSTFILVTLASVAFFWAIPKYGLWANSGWTMSEGWTLNGVKKASQIIIADVETPNYNVVMLLDAENQALPIRYFLNRARKSPLGIELYPVTQTLYVVAPNNLNLSQVPTWELTSFGPYQVEKSWLIENQYVLYRLEHLVQ